MLAHDRRKLLQQIIDDPASTDVERTEAKRALGEMNSSPAPRRYGRNANVPSSQADVDSDIENHFRSCGDGRLDADARREIWRALDESTRNIIDAIEDVEMLGSGQVSARDVPTLIDLVGRTQSDFVRGKCLAVLQLIADFSPIESVKTEAQEFLKQLNEEKDNT